MNATNILVDVDVPNQEGANFSDMFQMQVELQERLKQLPEQLDPSRMATKSIYWGHCVRTEVVELMEWLGQQTDPTWLKEMQMEAIDIVHFVFNIGIEIGISTDTIQYFDNDFSHNKWAIDSQRIQAASLMLEICIVELVNALPWKTWKTYKDVINFDVLGVAYSNVFNSTLLLCNSVGLERQGIINMYYAKNKVNHVRQDNGY